jgi:uncharacterized iron-regulated protein
MLVLVVLLVVQTGDARPPARQGFSPTHSSYVPERVYDSDRKRFTDFEAMLADLARADVVFVGEQHDDPATHRLELAMLEGLARRRADITLALEMFERDVQDALSRYSAGGISEEEFLQISRPWPRYATDYRPLVELAREAGWPIVASNIPRRLAAAVAKRGLEALASVPPDDRPFAAAARECPEDDYFRRFAQAMESHVSSGQQSDAETERATLRRYYLSQCLKDETMAESVVRARSDSRRLIVHVNGAFHSDFGDGAAERVRRRLPGTRVKVVTLLPVADLDALKPSRKERKRADYLVYTLKPAPAHSAFGIWHSAFQRSSL